MATKTLAIFILFTFTATFAYPRRHHNTPLQVDKIVQIITDIIQSINGNAAEGIDEIERYQRMLNNWYLFHQEISYLINKALNVFQDQAVKNSLIVALQKFDRISYGIVRNMYGDGKTIKQSIKTALQNIIDTTASAGRKTFEKPEREQQFALTVTRLGYDWALFHFHYMHTDINNRKNSNLEIQAALKTNDEALRSVLNESKSKNLTNSNEVLGILDMTSDISKLSLKKANRLIFAYGPGAQLQNVTDAIKALKKSRDDLKRHAGATATTLQLTNGLKKYFHNCLSAIHKLAEASSSSEHFVQEITKDIQLEHTALILTVNDLLHLHAFS